MKRRKDIITPDFLQGVFFLHQHNRTFITGEGNWVAAEIFRSLVIIVPLFFLLVGGLVAGWISEVPGWKGPVISSVLFACGLFVVIKASRDTLRQRQIIRNGTVIKGTILSFETAFNYNETNGVRVHYEFVSPFNLVKGQAEGPGNPPKSNNYSHILVLYIDEKNYMVL